MGPAKGRHEDGLEKNKLGKMGRGENKRRLLCISKWLVNTFAQTLCPIQRAVPTAYGLYVTPGGSSPKVPGSVTSFSGAE